MEDIQTGERTKLASSEYDQLVRDMHGAGVEIEELTDGKGNRTVRLPHKVYIAELNKLQARQRQQAKAKSKRRAVAKQGAASRARNRR